MQQPEVGEMLEGPAPRGRGRLELHAAQAQPVGCVHALAAGDPHARPPRDGACGPPLRSTNAHWGAGRPSSRWCPTSPRSWASALDFLDGIATSLVVDAKRMQANLEAQAPGAKPAQHAAEETLAALSPYL
jgi:hypothetical protein